MIYKIFALTALFASLGCSQVEPNPVVSYHRLKLVDDARTNLKDECHPDDPPSGAGECSRYLCKEVLTTFKCDADDEILTVARACHGNSSAKCVKALIESASVHNRDDVDEVTRLARSCKHNYGDSCVRSILGRLDNHEKDDVDELSRVGELCQDTDVGCIDFVCEHRNRFECDDVSELDEVARACRNGF